MKKEKTVTATSKPEATRLESLWSGEFGDAYVDRNIDAANGREPFWKRMLETYKPGSVLEIGCNVGGNLRWIAGMIEPRNVYGVDVNEKALQQIRAAVPGINAVSSPARDLPFRDGWFDLVFTMGVLIHQPESTLPLVMSEIVRCSNRYVLCGEYYSAETAEVPYRGHSGALFKRDYGRMYRELFPGLAEVASGHLTKDDGFDDVTWWMFEKSERRG